MDRYRKYPKGAGMSPSFNERKDDHEEDKRFYYHKTDTHGIQML